MTKASHERPVALVTGVSRKIGIGAAIALALAESHWDVATTFWRPYDATMPWGSASTEAQAIVAGSMANYCIATAASGRHVRLEGAMVR